MSRNSQTEVLETKSDEHTKSRLSVWEAIYNLSRKLGLTAIFGKPGSTEQPVLKNVPKDFQYVLRLQEASVVAMADGFSQATKRPVLLNLHSCAGGGLRWGSPAAVGAALAENKMGTGRPVVAVIRDGALQYSVQDLYTAAHQKL